MVDWIRVKPAMMGIKSVPTRVLMRVSGRLVGMVFAVSVSTLTSRAMKRATMVMNWIQMAALGRASWLVAVTDLSMLVSSFAMMETWIEGMAAMMRAGLKRAATAVSIKASVAMTETETRVMAAMISADLSSAEMVDSNRAKPAMTATA